MRTLIRNLKVVALVAMVFCVFGAWAETATPSITDVTARQRNPWNGKVDIAYTISGVAAAAKAKGMDPALKVLAVDRATTPWTTNVADSSALFVGPLGVEALTDAAATSDGTHRIVWDMNAQGLSFASANIVFAVLGETKALGGVQLWKDGPYWAECNVGATKPEGYGYYFWWGDTIGYKRNSADDGWDASDGSTTGFAFNDANPTIVTCHKDEEALTAEGYIDSTGNLVAAHDAATAHLGAPWRMPTKAELQALVDNCTTTEITTNEVNGRLVTGKGDYASKSIFLPAAGYGRDSYRYLAGMVGRYLSSSPGSNYAEYAWRLYFYVDFYLDSNFRFFCQPVRPLRSASGSGPELLCGDESAQVGVDLAMGTRVAAPTEALTYSADWCGGDSVALAANGATLEGASALAGTGTYTWTPSGIGTFALTHTVVTSGVPVVLTATFIVPTEPIVAKPTVVENTTMEVYTNGVLSAEFETGKWHAWSNDTAYVVYTAKPGYVFQGGVTVITNDLDTTVDPAVNKGGVVPAAPTAAWMAEVIVGTTTNQFKTLNEAWEAALQVGTTASPATIRLMKDIKLTNTLETVKKELID